MTKAFHKISSCFLLIAVLPFSAFPQTTAQSHHIEHPDARPPGHPKTSLGITKKAPSPLRNKKLNPFHSSFSQPPYRDRYRNQKTLSRHSSNNKNPSPLINPSGIPTSDSTEPVCDLQGFATKTGSALAQHILSMDFSCLGKLFDEAEKSIRIRAFRTQNMLSVAQVTEQRANSYNGNDELLGNYYLWLRTGFYNYFYHAEEMDWLPDNKTQIDRAMIQALTAFMENPNFYTISREHGIVLTEVLTGTDNAEQQAHFLPVYKQYLKQFNQNYLDEDTMAIVVNSIFTALFRGHQNADFQSAVDGNRELISILRNFALSDWILGTSMEWLAGNAALELARFLQYEEASIYSDVLSSVQDIFNRYDFFSGAGFEISIWALKNVLYFEKCERFQVCGIKEQLKNQVFSTGKYQCHEASVLIQSQNLMEEELMNACEILAHQETYFHEKLMTRQIPVEDDYNDTLEAVVFKDSRNYVLYSDLFFGNDTDNGGIYLEGDPSDPSNTARFFAYRATWLKGEPVWNLEHEYIHYLDGRYNLYGSFADYKIDTHNTVWWAEGLAEYISLKDDNPQASRLLFESTQIPALNNIIKTTYNSSLEFVYRWSYFAIRFMFEEHPEEVSRFLNYFRAGEYDSYLEYLNNSIGSKYNTAFSEWLEDLKSKYIHTIRLPVGESLANNNIPDRIDLSSYFLSTQDLSFQVTSSNPSTLQVEIVEGRFLVLKPRLPGVSEITITASSNDNSVDVIFSVTVVPSIRTFAVRFDDLSTFDRTTTIDLSKYVEGPPKRDIIFSAESLNPNVASVHIEGSLLTITALRKGSARIRYLGEYEGIRARGIFHINIVDGESFAGEYCFGQPSDTGQAYISEISLAGKRIADHRNKTYSLSNAGNVNTIYVFVNSSYTLDVIAGTASTAGRDSTNRVEAWVDWNTDNTFSSETEKVMDEQVVLSSTNVFPKVSSVLKAPEGTEQGYKRLRVRISSTEENYPSACSNYESGETEDHLVWVYPGFVNIVVNDIAGEKQSVLKIKTSTKEIPLSEVFYVNDHSPLTYSARSLDPNQVQVQIENNKLIIRKPPSAKNFQPAKIILKAAASGHGAEKELSVVFEPYTLPLVLSAETLSGEEETRHSFVRVTNNSNQDGVVYITGRDDSGRVRGPISLSLKARSSAHFNSTDLAKGNTDKGLTGSLGSGQGNWRLTLESDLDFHAAAYIRLNGGAFVTSMNELTALERNGDSYNYFVPIFNPASNQRQRSLLKLFNPNDSEARVRITGTDDQGRSQNVQLTLSPQTSKMITALDLENGAEDLEGRLGNGQGKWRLSLSSSHSLDVMNLMENPTGHLSNLSESSDEGVQKILLPAQDNRHGFIRIINHSGEDGEVTITATDDLSRRYPSISLPISALEAKHFNSFDLQNGNEDKGLPYAGLGPPQGMWRLKFESDLNISVFSYMRSSDGFLTSLNGMLSPSSSHRQIPYDESRYTTWFFNPGSNQNQRSSLRFINTDINQPAFVSIRGVDDKGNLSGEVSFTVPAGSTKTLDALELETGRALGLGAGSASDLRGALGDGQGKWHLRINTGWPVSIMNLLESPNGYISNLSFP